MSAAQQSGSVHVSAPVRGNRLIDLTGRVFGRLTVLSFAGVGRNGHARWRVRCICGVEKVTSGQSLRAGNSTSCGCYQREVSAIRGLTLNKVHGMHRAPTHDSWTCMLQRCNNPKNKDYKHYGARGITVCDRWRSFDNFLADMGERPEGKTLDRWPDKDGRYEPGNCRWATAREQAQNMRSNRLIEHAGETLCVAEWARRTNITVHCLRDRLAAGWAIETALTKPMQKRTKVAARAAISSIPESLK